MLFRSNAMDKANELLHADALAQMKARGDNFDEQIARVSDASVARATIHDERFLTTLQRLDGEGQLLDAKLDALSKIVDTRFSERDVRAEREARDNKIAVDAAFAAAKEAVAAQNIANNESIAKSEASVTKQIDGLAGQAVTREIGRAHV